MPTQSGSTYISKSMTEIIKSGFHDHEQLEKVSASDFNSDRQPKIAKWAPKLKILISLKL